MKLNIIGGTYYEVCRDPSWLELYGSGLRAAHALTERCSEIVFHTAIGSDDFSNLSFIAKNLNIGLNAILTEFTPTFEYDYPLSSPFFPQTVQQLKTETVNCDSVIQFGMLEGGLKVCAKSAIYDPQSPGNPKSFWSYGSEVRELIWVSNLQEAKRFTGCESVSDIKNYLFNDEGVSAGVLKNGSDGAILIQRNKDDYSIPAFKSSTVWPIGTGDIFTAIFGHSYLIGGCSLEASACSASLATAQYAQTATLPIPKLLDSKKFIKFTKSTNEVKKVYLAGPFFNMQQRWLIEQFKIRLTEFGFNVFSPYHDIGLGEAQKVVPADIQAIESADLVLAIVDGLDSGTLFEIGYAKAFKKSVLAFVENEKSEALTMLKGTDCIIESDFSTIIYKAVWEAYK